MSLCTTCKQVVVRMNGRTICEICKPIRCICGKLLAGDDTICNNCKARCNCGKVLVVGKESVICVECSTCENCQRRCGHASNSTARCYGGVVRMYPMTAQLQRCVRHNWKFCNLEKGKKRARLCGECHGYFSGETSQSNCVSKYVWPSFVWSVLRREDTVEEVWALLPKEWRIWWEDSFSALHGLTEENLAEWKPLFLDVTEAYELDTGAINSLIWTELMSREKSLVLPTVKCPAGCSEFKHKVNELPFDVVWEECLQVELNPLFSDRTVRQFTRFFRKDYLMEDKIISNPDWICKASIARTGDGGPSILCCRFHSHTTRGQMVHSALHPTGSLSSSKAGALSPVVAVPRTIQKARMRGFSAAFQMNKLEGSFNGLDSMYMGVHREIASVQMPLAWEQDVYAYAGRKDIRAFTQRKYRSTWGSGGCIASKIDQDAQAIMPYMDELMERFQSGATYVSIEDAISTQAEVDFGSPELATVINQKGAMEEKQFRGAYPRRLIWSHPAASRLGCKPPCLPKFAAKGAKDTRLPWLVSAMMLMVPELWQSVAALPGKTDWSWEGYFLTFLTQKSLTHVRSNASSNHPFTAGGLQKEVLQYFPVTTVNFDPAILHVVFGAHPRPFPGLVLCDGRLPDAISEDANVCVVIRDANAWSVPMKVDLDGRVWKLCFVGQSWPGAEDKSTNDWDGEVFCRHSSGDISHWWRATRKMDLSTAVNTSSIPVDAMDWSVCVYVAQESYTKTSLRDKVLASCGGQSSVYCREHDYPLITSPKTDVRTCFCKDDKKKKSDAKCGLVSIYSCVVPTCSSAMCRKHVRVAVESGEKVLLEGVCPPCSVDRKGAREEDSDIVAGDFMMPFLDVQEQDDVLPDLLRRREDDDSDIEDMYNEWDSDGSSSDGVDIGEDDGDQFEAHFRLKENMDDDIFATTTMQGTADMEDVIPQDIADILAAEEAAEPRIPTTDAGMLPIWTLTKGDYVGATVNNHVLLNNFGHMLIRRNRKLTGTLNQKHFLQRLVSRMPGDSTPLIYPEGMLFSDLFYTDTGNGSVIGAIPSCMLNADRAVAELGFCSLEDHYRSRLSHPGLLSSSNPKYHFFAFDCMANLGLRGCDSRVILRRGFAEHQGKGGVRFKGRDEPLFDTEHVDCRPIVNQLSAAAHEDSPTYFYTHTANMRYHFGIKYLWDWLAGEKVLEQFVFEGSVKSDEEIAELRRTIVDGSGVLLLRAWMEMMHIWIVYITESPEKPIGDVTKYLFRMELQDARGNLPHLHSMLWTNDDLTTEEGLENAFDRIRGFVRDIVRPEEREQYLKDGVFEDDSAVVRFQEMMSVILAHHHDRRCLVTRKRKRGDGEEEEYAEPVLKCKANINYKENPCPAMDSLIELPVEHSEEAMAILIELGFAVMKDGVFKPTAKWLIPSKHYPEAHGHEGIISPVFGALAARNPNMQNAQFATGYTLSRYLAKYIVMIDLYNTIRITPPRKTEDKDTFNVEGEELPNQKITGNAIEQKKKEGKDSQRVPKHREGRAINVVEFYMMLFNYDPVMTNMKFVKIETKGFDERPAQDRKKPIDSIKKMDRFRLQHVAATATNTIPSDIVRTMNGFPGWRRMSDAQRRTVFDDLQSPLGTSSVTRFSVRPPELMFITKQADYFGFFTSEPNPGKMDELVEWVSECTSPWCVADSVWIDGFTSTVKIRALAVPKIVAILRQREHAWFRGYDEMLPLFESINAALDTAHDRRSDQQRFLLRVFVSEMDKKRLPVVWYESVRPTRTNRFLVHLLLSLGHIKTEYEIFAQPSIRHSFIAAGLLDTTDPAGSALRVARAYIAEQLACLPSGTRTFDAYLKAAHQTIYGLFVHNTIITDDVPTVLYTHVKEQTEDKIVAYLKEQKTVLVKHILKELTDCGIPNLPTEEECMEATLGNPCEWTPMMVPRSRDQPVASHEEQRRVLRLSMNLTDHYKNATNEFTKGLCQVGAGGVGKTTLLFLELLYDICQGLVAGITALLSERAQEIGGKHLHEIFCFPVNEKLSPGQLAERALSTLYRSPEKMEYLRVLDSLGLDEAGAIPCELLAAVCHVLRVVRDNNRPQGGLLTKASLDHLQIDPVKGRHSLMSPTFTTCMFFRELKLSVRAALDVGLQRVQAITRMDPMELSSPEIRQEWMSLFPKVCNFVYSLDGLPQNAVFVFGKKEPLRTQTTRILNRAKREARVYRISVARDEQRTIDGNFEPASNRTIRTLNREVKEPKNLVFFPNGRFQITYNSHGRFSNSQLAVALVVPAQKTLDDKMPVTLMVAPAGSRYIPGATATQAELTALGWREMQIGIPRRYQVHNSSGSVRGKRTQYGMRHHVGSTIHGIMGQTLETLVTRVERGDKSMPYALWLVAQVVVLLSRTRQGKDTYFWIGNNDSPEDVAATLYDLLCQTSRFREHLSIMLKALCNEGAGMDQALPYVIDHSSSIFRAKDIPVPGERIGYVYLLVSTKTLRDVYIGSTIDLVARWKKHNSGFGALQTTDDRKRPWGIVAYITGFAADKARYTAFENTWIARKEDMKRENGGITLEEIHNLGKALVATHNAAVAEHNQLQFVTSGTVERQKACVS